MAATSADDVSKLLPLHVDGLTPELVEKAQEELGETPERRQQALSKLKDLLLAETDLIPCLDEDFLLAYIRCRKYKIDAALKRMLDYYEARIHHSGTLLNITPKALEHVINQNVITPLPYRNVDNCTVTVLFPGKVDMNVTSIWEFVAAGFIVAEDIVLSEAGQIAGFAVIADFKGCTWRQVASVTPSFMYAATQVARSLPYRAKAVHILNEPAGARKLLKIAMKLIQNKIAKRFVFHGSDLSSLHKACGLPLSALPEEFGGTLRSDYHLEYAKHILGKENQFKKMSSCGFVGKRAEAMKKGFSLGSLASRLPSLSWS